MQSLIYGLLTLILLDLFIQAHCDHATFSAKYEFRFDLSEGRYTMYWNNVNSEDEICFAINVQTTGWVGLGFSPNGDMALSDIVMGWVKDGVITFDDRWAEVRGEEPSKDAESNYELVSGGEVNGNTSFEFCRKLLTCDEFDREITTGTTRVIFSWNDEDPNPLPEAHKVETRGSRSINLLNDNVFEGTDPSDLEYFEFHSGNYTIPAVDTTYYCIMFPYPRPSAKRHLIRISVELSPLTKNYVHHIVLYVCNGDYPTNIRGLKSSSEFQDIKCFSSVLGVWAVGGMEFNFPPDVGFPIDPSDPDTNMLFEIHYNNPQLDEGLIDNSGMRLYHTGQLRAHEAGLITFGNVITNAMMIPPQASHFTIQTHCPRECTNTMPHNITVFASLLHTHLTGVAIWSQIIRDGKEIENLDSNLNYDFDFQDFIIPAEPVIIQPGDEIIVNCQYKTEGHTDYTIGGESTREEMCFHFIYYYPRVSLDFCVSQYNIDTVYDKTTEDFICNGIVSNGTNILDASKVPWDRDDRIFRTLEESPQKVEDSLSVYCHYRNIPDPVDYSKRLLIPDVDYIRFPYTTDKCGRSNSTYYLRNEVYDCNSADTFSRINLVNFLTAIIIVILLSI